MQINTLFLAYFGASANTHFCLPYPHWIFTGLTSLSSQLTQDILFYDTFSKIIEPHAKKFGIFWCLVKKTIKFSFKFV